MHKSIHKEFIAKLIFFTSVFIIILSFMFYNFTKTAILEDIRDGLINDAILVNKLAKLNHVDSIRFISLTKPGLFIDIIYVISEKNIFFHTYKDDLDSYAQILYPFGDESNIFIMIQKNINNFNEILNTIFKNLLFICLGFFIMIILYSLTISKILVNPILKITSLLSKMNENALPNIKIQNFPVEFHPLVDSVNDLTNRLEKYIDNQKELFLGVAHELKTPLAVMKLKNDITLRKTREPTDYTEALNINNIEITNMNNMISSVLEIGRQEGAFFEIPTSIDIVFFLKNKMDDYWLLANKSKVNILFTSSIETFNLTIQPTLLNQIMQNFVQNALKHTPDNKTIRIVLYVINKQLKIDVIDEGPGIDETIDIFAPFVRQGNKKGAGLGLFLVKNAANAMGASVSVANRKDGSSGAIASLTIYAEDIK